MRRSTSRALRSDCASRARCGLRRRCRHRLARCERWLRWDDGVERDDETRCVLTNGHRPAVHAARVGSGQRDISQAQPQRTRGPRHHSDSIGRFDRRRLSLVERERIFGRKKEDAGVPFCLRARGATRRWPRARRKPVRRPPAARLSTHSDRGRRERGLRRVIHYRPTWTDGVRRSTTAPFGQCAARAAVPPARRRPPSPEPPAPAGR